MCQVTTQTQKKIPKDHQRICGAEQSRITESKTGLCAGAEHAARHVSLVWRSCDKIRISLFRVWAGRTLACKDHILFYIHVMLPIHFARFQTMCKGQTQLNQPASVAREGLYQEVESLFSWKKNILNTDTVGFFESACPNTVFTSSV